MSSNSLHVNPITATSATATNTTPATFAASTRRRGPPPPTETRGPPPLPSRPPPLPPRASTSCPLHRRTSPSGLCAIRFKLAEIKAGQHPPPPPAAVPALSATPTLPASVASKGRPTWWPPAPSPIPTWTDASPVYTQTAAWTTVQQPAHTFGGPGGFAAPIAESTSVTTGRQEGAYGVTPLAQQPPRFTKLEFATYDGATDP
nr:uncharacterized protein LOC127303193 [Lolium perenne]